MLRPTRSIAVTEIDIVAALRWCNLIKTKSFAVQIIGISRFASWKATMQWLTLGHRQGCGIARLSGQMLRTNGAALIGPPKQAADCWIIRR